MIEITARCQHCSWKWRPRKADGPDVDFARAKNAAAVHRRQNPRHQVETRRFVDERSSTKRGLVVYYSLEVETR